jgi:outer membrane lipoprotein-sorting protein
MSRHRTTRRFAVPVALAVGIVAVAAGAGLVSANDAHDLPPRTAAELLADVHNSDVDGLSGTVMQNADLGLPDLGEGTSGISALASGNHQLRLWYAAPDKVRTAVMDDLGEFDTIRNGADMWIWSSQRGEAAHYTLPDEAAEAALWPPSPASGDNPAEVAEQALDAIEPTTRVTSDGTVEVADRPAYQLSLQPKDEDCLISEVNLAIDAETGVPLRTEVYAAGKAEPVFDVAFSRIEFDVPDAENFDFTAPAGVTVSDGTDDMGQLWEQGRHDKSEPKPQVVGDGWTTVLVSEFDAKQLAAGQHGDGEESGQDFGDDADVTSILQALPEVSGEWGSGRLFSSSLVNALITDDGRLLAGAVTPQRLYEVAAQ